MRLEFVIHRLREKWDLADFLLLTSQLGFLGEQKKYLYFACRYSSWWYIRNVLGGNFALVGSPSTGASGAIFGTVAVSSLWIYLYLDSHLASKITWVDLFAHWKYQYRPVRKVRAYISTIVSILSFRLQLIFMTIELVIGIAVGYIPCMPLFSCMHTNWLSRNLLDVDNFGSWNFFFFYHRIANIFGHEAHLGGLLMGLLVGTTLYPVISVTKRHRLIMWIFRLLAIPLAVILFVVLIRNFYTSDPYAGKNFTFRCKLGSRSSYTLACTGCRYLSCFPTASNNHCQGYVLTWWFLRPLLIFFMIAELVGSDESMRFSI